MDHMEIDRRFKYHAPNSDTLKTHEYIRAAAMEFAVLLNRNLPESREKSLALTALEESHFWSHAAVARNP